MGTFPPCLSKSKYSEVPETFLESVVFHQQCAQGTSLSLSLKKTVWLRIYLPNIKSNQNWLFHIHKPSIKKKKSWRIVSYNPTGTIVMFLWFLRWRKRGTLPLQLRRVSKNERRVIQKLTFDHSIIHTSPNEKIPKVRSS